MNNELQILSDWFRANKLSVNAPNTNYMLFTKHTNCNIGQNVLYLNDELLTCVQSTKFLGLVIDNHLEWNYKIAACYATVPPSRFIPVLPPVHQPGGTCMNLVSTGMNRDDP